MERNDRVGEERPVCVVCGGTGPFFLRAGDLFYQVTDYIANLYRCDSCGSLFQWPVPDRDLVAQFYPGGYWREETEPSFMIRLQSLYVKTLLKWDLMKWVKRLKLPTGSRWLDVGCSRGDWLALIGETGLKVKGLEADPRAAVYARQKFGLTIEEVDAESWRPQEGGFDAVSFFHLLEHLGNPAAFLTRCRQALADGGRILLRVPNAASWQRVWFGKRWKGLELPRHLVLFTPHSLRLILEREGFEVETLSTWSLRDGPPAMSSSLFPQGEPTCQEIKGKSQPLFTLVYLALTWLFTPVEILVALWGKGSMITVVARKKS